MYESQAAVPNPLIVDDFSGGITDNFLPGRFNQYKEAKNFLIQDNRTLLTRPGTVVYDLVNFQTPDGNKRINNFITTDDFLFHAVERNLHYIDTTFKTVLGPTGNPVIPAGDATNQIDWDEWQKHFIITNSTQYGAPMKMYRDENEEYQVRNAGLPIVTLINSIALANELKSKFNAHVADAGAHTGPGGADTANIVTSVNAIELSSLMTLTNEMVTKYAAHDADAELGSPDHHTAQEASDHSLTSVDAAITLSEIIERLNDLKSVYDGHDADATAHASASGHQLSAGFFTEPQFSGTAGANNFIYTFVPFFEYKIGTVTYRDFGPIHEKLVTNINSPDVNAVSIDNIPVITNGSTLNFATTKIRWQIYRTEANGTTSYLAQEVTNGTTSTTDDLSDADLVLKQLIYTTGGIVSNGQPPDAKYVVTVNNITWYANTRVGNEERSSRLYQSIQFDPDSVPATFFEDIEDEIVGMGSVNIYPIVFCKNRIYRIEGFLDEFGAGVINKREISRTRGAINHLSIVSINPPNSSIEGIVFATTTGFYFTDGFNLTKISDEFNKRYKIITTTTAQRRNIFGAFDAANDRVYWAVTANPGSSDNDSFFVFDMDFGVKKDAAFTTVSASQSWMPTAIAFDQDEKLVIGDSRGFAFNFAINALTDPKVDLTTDPINWEERTMIYDFVWVNTDFGNPNINKWVTQVVINLENRTNISMMPSADTNNEGSFMDLREVRSRGNITWGDYSAVWLDPNRLYKWNAFPMIIERRRFGKGKLRAVYKSLRFSNALTIVSGSDAFGLATVDNTANTATLETFPTIIWSGDSIDYFLSFENDNYDTNFLITDRTDEVLTFQGDELPQSTAPDGAGEKWIIRGVAKGEVLNLISFSINWLPLTSLSNKPFRTSDLGANA